MSYKKLFNEEGEELVIVPLSDLKRVQAFKDVELGTRDEWDDPVEIVSTNPICYYVPVGHGVYKPTMSRKEFLKHACIEIAKLRKATNNNVTIGDCIDQLLTMGFQLYDLCLALKEDYKAINHMRVLADEDIPPFLKQKFAVCFSEYCEWYPNHIEPEQASECILNYRTFNGKEFGEKKIVPVTKSVGELFSNTEAQKEQKESHADKEVISRKTVTKTSQTSPSAEENDAIERLFASTKYKPIVKFNRGEIKDKEEGFERLEGTHHIGFSLINAFDPIVKVRITYLIKENFFGFVKELGVGPFTNPYETKLFLTTIGVPYAAFARMCGISDTCNQVSQYYLRKNAKFINEIAGFEFAIVKPEKDGVSKSKKEKLPKPKSARKLHKSRAEFQTEAIRAKAKEDFEKGIRFHSSEDLRQWFVSNHFKLAAFCREAHVYSNTIYGSRQQLRRETIDKTNTWLGVNIAELKTDANPTLPKDKLEPDSEEQDIPSTEKKVDKEIREFLHRFPKYYFKTVSSILRALEEKFQRSDAIDVLCLTDEDLANPSMLSFGTSVYINKFVGKSVTFAGK